MQSGGTMEIKQCSVYWVQKGNNKDKKTNIYSTSHHQKANRFAFKLWVHSQSLAESDIMLYQTSSIPVVNYDAERLSSSDAHVLKESSRAK